ncbi:MAG: response regulator [Candidatus Atribacteria bacterium]|nr:MAG: response regulator [Candidatus Atribacteria bacterium]
MTKLLIIDDERAILEVLDIYLTSEGYEVITAENGKEGLEIFEKEGGGINLVITDIKMPEIEGLEVLRRLKAIDKDTEVIVVTGHGDMDSAIESLKYGASDFINKPIRFEALILALERAKQKIAMSRQLKDYTKNLEQKIEERTLELRQAQEELMASERLATIGETVAGLAHYIKNILTGLRGGMYMVDVGMAKGKPRMQQDGWGMVRRNIEKVSDLVLDLLKYSKERMPEPTVCSPNKIVLEGVELMREKAGQHGVKLSTDLDPNLKEAFLDQDGINDVLLNLISNAIDACLYDTNTSKVWEVKVKTRLETDARSGEVILFQVIDNGAGMTDAVKAKLFTRFFSTKAGRGTGLGLLITQKIMNEPGGEVSVESEVGQGTTFSVRFNRYMQKS